MKPQPIVFNPGPVCHRCSGMRVMVEPAKTGGALVAICPVCDGPALQQRKRA